MTRHNHGPFRQLHKKVVGELRSQDLILEPLKGEPSFAWGIYDHGERVGTVIPNKKHGGYIEIIIQNQTEYVGRVSQAFSSVRSSSMNENVHFVLKAGPPYSLARSA